MVEARAPKSRDGSRGRRPPGEWRMAVERITIPQIQRMKDEGKKLVVMTAYDYELARIVDHAGPEMILVGDSGGRPRRGGGPLAARAVGEIKPVNPVARGVRKSGP